MVCASTEFGSCPIGRCACHRAVSSVWAGSNSAWKNVIERKPMAHTVIVHIHNEDPFMAEMEEFPDPHATFLTITNPRQRDGKPLHYVDREAVKFFFPWTRITFVEVLGTRRTRDDVIEFFRE